MMTLLVYMLTERPEGSQSLKPAAKASFKKRPYRFLTGRDGSQTEVHPRAESSGAAGAEVHGGANDG